MDADEEMGRILEAHDGACLDVELISIREQIFLPLHGPDLEAPAEGSRHVELAVEGDGGTSSVRW
jgi:hypothetical protein